MRRFLALILAFCTLIPLFAACGKKEQLKLFEDGSAILVYDDSLLSNSERKAFVDAVEQATGATLTVKREYSGEGTKILLGNIKHENCQAVTKDLRINDYALKISGGDYVIGAVTAESLKKAMEYFLTTVLSSLKKGVLTLTAEDDYLYEGTYKADAFTIGGVSLGRLQIVIPEEYSASEFRTAVLLQQYLKTSTGYDLTIKKGSADADAEGKILIGQSLCTKANATAAHSWSVAVNGATLEIAAESFYGYEAVQKALQNQIFTAKAENKTLTDETAFSGVGAPAEAVLSHDGDIRIMFNNIHGSCDPTEFPVKPVAQMMSEVYKEYLPDILGLQECSPQMRTSGDIRSYLAPEYTEVDVTSSAGYRDNSRINYTPLFYRQETVEVLKSGFFCFNFLPYTDEAYSDMWQGCDPGKLLEENVRQSDGATVTKNGRKDSSKGATWAVFRSKETGNIFLVASTHLWWESNDVGDSVTRQIQLAYLKDMLLHEAQTFLTENGISAETMPIFVGGDYNARSTGKLAADLAKMTAATPLILCADETLSAFANTNILAPSGKRNTVSTHHAYATWNESLGIYENPQRSGAEYLNSLDYIFVNKSAEGMYTVTRSAMSDDNYSYLSSDHCPILIDFTFTGSAPKK